MLRSREILLLVVAVSVMGGCSLLKKDGGNTNTATTVNTNTAKDSGAAASPTPAPSATPAPIPQNVNERIKFGKGKEGATVKGEVTANGSSTYTLGAQAGQLMNIEVTSGKKGVCFDLIDKSTGDTLAENQTSWGESLASTGDYTIRVYSTKGGDTYTLKVSIQDEGE
jgi:hypothetical protein